MRAQATLLASVLACLPLVLGACDRTIDLDQVEGQIGDSAVNELELCGHSGEMRECNEGEGTQFCYTDWGSASASGEFDNHWGECLSDFVCMPGESRSCGLGLGINQGCVVGDDGVPTWDENACNTPLVLSFEGGPIEMQASSAAFDISGAGMCLSTDWPAARNPWLAIDLDRNGFIDGGHELFGSGSVLESGVHASNGFLALATLDSNTDGKIDAADERFAEILVWRDEDGDKYSLPWELTTLAHEGVTSIDLDYTLGETCDERGNCGRERSRFEFLAGGQRQVGEVVDVYLACQ